MKKPRTAGGAKNPQEALKSAEKAIEILSGLLLTGLEQSHIDTLQTSVHPETWKERKWGKRLYAGRKLSTATLDAVRELREHFEVIRGIAGLLLENYTKQLAALRKQARELSRWWAGLTDEQRAIGVKAIEKYGKRPFKQLKAEAGLEEKVLYLEIAKHEIEIAQAAAKQGQRRRRAATSTPLPQPQSLLGPPGRIGRR